MDKATLTAATEVLSTDSEKVCYLYQDAHLHANNTQEFITYVQGKGWTEAEKIAVMIEHGFHICQREEAKVVIDMFLSSLRLGHIMHGETVTAESNAEDKLAHLTTIEDPLDLIGEARNLKCGMENYIHVGMLIACM